MSAKPYELWHGLVLTKILRSGRPISLRMIETNPSESWSTYALNDEVDLFICFNTAARSIERGGAAHAWRFNFSANQARQLQGGGGKREVWAALVCGFKSPGASGSQICLLNPSEIQESVDFSKEQPGVSVRVPNGKGQIRVIKDRREAFKVPKSRLESWDIPGA